jgi:hypothetical protein
MDIKKSYKRKLSENENLHSETMARFRQKCEDLRIDSEKVIINLTKEHGRTRKDLMKTTEELSQFEAFRQEYFQNNAGLTISEKTLSAKLNSVNEQLEAERKAWTSKEESLQSTFQIQLEMKTRDLINQLRKMKNLLKKIAYKKFGKMISEGANLLKIIQNELEKRNDPFNLEILSAAFELRRRYGEISDSTSNSAPTAVRNLDGWRDDGVNRDESVKSDNNKRSGMDR